MILTIFFLNNFLAGFSREYQSSQKCMCDSEHMFNCPGQDSDGNQQMETDLESFLASQFHTQEHKNLVAKKFHVKKVGEFWILHCLNFLLKFVSFEKLSVLLNTFFLVEVCTYWFS
jgi:hypothetical protein